MKKKILIVAGAGASLEFGMPSVSEIDSLFSTWSTDFYCLSDDPTKSLYTYVRDGIANYYKKCPKAGLAKSINFEETLYTLMQLAAIKGDDLCKNPLNAFCNLTKFPSIHKFKHKHDLPTGFDFYHLASHLVDKLLEELRSRCKEVQTSKKPEFMKLSKFMTSLSNDFEVGIITPNYDNLFKQALPSLETGFDEGSGLFHPEKLYRNTNWGFCYHIHGSVHFDQFGSKYDMHEIGWQSSLDATFKQNSSGRSSQLTMEGLSLPTSVIVAGYDKSNQIKRNPFRTYYSQLDRFALEADAVLFLGYGFADLHLNTCFDRIRDDKRRPVVVIDYAGDDQDPMQFRRDDWSHNLYQTIPFNAHTMSYKDYSIAVSIGEIKDEKEFEVSKDHEHPLAIWYNGFLEACENYDKIKAHLSA